MGVQRQYNLPSKKYDLTFTLRGKEQSGNCSITWHDATGKDLYSILFMSEWGSVVYHGGSVAGLFCFDTVASKETRILLNHNCGHSISFKDGDQITVKIRDDIVTLFTPLYTSKENRLEGLSAATYISINFQFETVTGQVVDKSAMANNDGTTNTSGSTSNNSITADITQTSSAAVYGVVGFFGVIFVLLLVVVIVIVIRDRRRRLQMLIDSGMYQPNTGSQYNTMYGQQAYSGPQYDNGQQYAQSYGQPHGYMPPTQIPAPPTPGSVLADAVGPHA